MKKLLYAVIVSFLFAGYASAGDPPIVRFMGGALTDLENTYPVFELSVDWPFDVKEVRGFAFARMGSISGQDISIDEPGSWKSAEVAVGLHKGISSGEYSNASMRTSLCLFIGGNTPLAVDESVVPSLAKFGGLGALVRDIKSGSYGLLAYGVYEEGLTYIPPGDNLPKGYYGMGQILFFGNLRVPHAANALWFGVEGAVHIQRNQFEDNRDILRAWVAVDPVAVLGKFVK